MWCNLVNIIFTFSLYITVIRVYINIFDDEQVSTRMPDKLNVKLPKVAIMCFFKEVVKEYSKLDEVNNVMTVYHDIIDWNYYEMSRDKKNKVVFTQAPMGAPLCI
mgnify:CR=1 FL=1